MAFSEHILFFLLAVVLPYYIFPKKGNTSAGPVDFSRPSVHRNYLRNTIVWLVVAIIVPYFVTEKAGKSLSEIWLDYTAWTASDFYLAGAFGLLAVLLTFLATLPSQGRKILVSDLWKRNTKHQPPLPISKNEIIAYPLLEVAEAISSEVVYRAFIIYYLANFLPIYVAAALSVPIFIWSEMFRGRSEALLAGAYGAVCAALLVSTGNIFAPLFFVLGFRLVRLGLALKEGPPTLSSN